jgi:hypothetical protein
MAVPISLPTRLAKVFFPTKIQAFLCLILALGLLIGAQGQQILRLLGVDDVILDASRTEVNARFTHILTSSIASASALVTFWAGVGLVAYLVCWGAYNVLVEARNKVTLETQYTNRGGHWHGAFETLGLKLLGAITLICFIALLKPGLALWLALIAPLLGTVSVNTILMALGATLGLALQLYLLLAFALLTFTPWYREEAFTDLAE